MQRNNSNGETPSVARKSTKAENKTDGCEFITMMNLNCN